MTSSTHDLCKLTNEYKSSEVYSGEVAMRKGGIDPNFLTCDFCSFTYNEEHKSYELHVGQKVPCGDEVLIRYGSLSNNDLLAFYGFVQLGNVWDSISVAGSALEEYASHSKKGDFFVIM